MSHRTQPNRVRYTNTFTAISATSITATEISSVIDPEQAKTVRKIYDWYLDGMGVRQIQFELEKEGVLTAMGKTRWYESNISKILKNPFYAGNTLILHIRSLNPHGYMS